VIENRDKWRKFDTWGRTPDGENKKGTQGKKKDLLLNPKRNIV